MLQVLSYVTGCIRPLGLIASTGNTKTKHQLSTTNLCEERLAVTLRYLASSDLQQSHDWAHRTGKATISIVIKEIINAI